MAGGFKHRRRRANGIVFVLFFAVFCVGASLFYLHYLKMQTPPPVLRLEQRMATQPSAAQNVLEQAKAAYPRLLSAKAAQQAIDDATAAERVKKMRESVTIGAQYGQMRVENTKIQCPLFYGDSEAQFSRGAGTSAAGKLPGDGGTVLIAAHTGTYFADLGSAAIGTLIHLDTDWGKYTYRVTDAKVVEETDIAACNLDAGYENCILYTCYPFGQLTRTPYRWFVYATLENIVYDKEASS
ncbi:MAG: class D sortase [Ruthenibacterium sp.]